MKTRTRLPRQRTETTDASFHSAIACVLYTAWLAFGLLALEPVRALAC